MNEQFEVRSGIPVPPSAKGRPRGHRGPYKKTRERVGLAKAQEAAAGGTRAKKVVLGFTIESGVPIKQGGTGRLYSYAALFAAMKIGDSFRFTKTQAVSMRSLTSRYSIKMNKKFVYRSSKTTGAGRVWRVK